MPKYKKPYKCLSSSVAVEYGIISKNFLYFSTLLILVYKRPRYYISHKGVLKIKNIINN